MSSPTETKTVAGPRTFTVAVPQPYNGTMLFSFLRGRALPGIEVVTDVLYRRRIATDRWVEAELADGRLLIRIGDGVPAASDEILDRLRRVFDLDTDPKAVDVHLARVPKLAPLVSAEPGLRVPGVWDSFEGCVRAVLGQQVSVARARDLATALCERFGDGTFPDAQTLADAEVAAIGLPGTRGRAISALAKRVVDEGAGWLDDPESLRAGFLDIRGLGPWTAEYAAMRVGRDRDAFPDSDWGVVKALGLKGADARRWAAPCRPWRAYATMHLWCSGTA